MSLKDVDLEHALRRLAERRIEDAMREGKFSNLPGAGKPIDLEPMPADENARLMWWALRIMKNADFTPEEIQWRKRIDHLKDELVRATTEKRVEALVTLINGVVRQINTLGTNAISSAVAPLSLEVELNRLRERLATAAAAMPVSAPRAAPKRPTKAPAPAHVTVPFARRAPASAESTRPADRAPTLRLCRNPACKCRNPDSAKFCRRCGRVLGEPVESAT
jgi:hypothetical protein